MFQKAVRKKAKLKLCLTGVSGSGKTMSALRLAAGISDKIALIDTECHSASLYAHIANFDVLELSSPYTVERYIDAIEQAEKADYEVLVIDSMTHVWSGDGGVLSTVDEITQSSKSKNSYMAWAKGTKMQDALTNKILSSPLHIIITLRSKTHYDVVDNGQGRKSPVKIGLAAIQREGYDYDYQCVLDIARENHFATASKDRTNLFGDNPFLITEETGKKLVEWLNEGVEAPKPMEAVSAPKLRLDFVQQINACKDVDALNLKYKELIEFSMTEEQKQKLIKACSARKQNLISEDDIPQ